MLAGPLGFGCSALVGGRTRREAERLLAAAVDAGVRHFDVARVYGTGDAERLVGAFVRDRGEAITLATKFGIDPIHRSPLTDVAKRVVRVAGRRSRRVLGAARRHSAHTTKRGDFSPEKACSSLRTSLTELGLDQVDAYLMHDCAAADWASAELRVALEELVTAGLTRSFGTATGRAETLDILAGRDAPPVAQFDSSALEPGPIAELRRAGSVTVTYSALSRALPELRGHFTRRPELSAEWSRALDLDASSMQTLAELLLADALARNRGGVVLFASAHPQRIERAAAVARDAPFSRDQLEHFRSLTEALIAAAP